MIDYGDFCYLDVHKTGSSFVEAFLRRHVRRDPVEVARHKVVPGDAPGPDEKLYFITCRDPVAQWRSLYFYGVQGKGLVLNRLRRRRLARRYYDGTSEGLNAWLDAMLDPESAAFEALGIPPGPAALVGLQSFRFLRLSFRGPGQAFRRMKDRDDVRRLYAEERLHRHVLRCEALEDGLATLARGPLAPHVADPAVALSELDNAEPVNRSSNSTSAASVQIAPEIIERIREREWFLYETLGFDDRVAVDGS